MSKKNTTIGQEELAVFRFVQQSHPISVRDVSAHFASLGKARTTVLTVMERLREKGLLTREKTSGVNRYSPTVESEVLMRSLVGDFVTKILGGSVSPFVAYMSEADEVSDEDLKELKRVVRDLDKRRKENS